MTASENPPSLSVDDAARKLPLVRSIVRDIVQLHQEVENRRERLRRVRRLRGKPSPYENVYSDELADIEAELDRDGRQIEEYITELDDLGVELRDANTGIVEFRGQLDFVDAEVYLGWIYDEPEMSYWRPLDSDLSDQHSLFEDSLQGDTDVTGEPPLP
ncbi:DUF2203 family protein [Calycomorphotria hydatis]|uniref:DUF2203 domain-containing protein n=1 Tax=Calycomorphotria hydatis TaxID=2528027 RepID=A0A517T7Z4_9PLAN|nr:DUF2203 family protein [Calycomorphotria hydatis]QDT64495.1 hypothetical protein V22_17290 [Calycomorphotria hydatis]